MKELILDVLCWIEERCGESLCLLCITVLLITLAFGAHKHRNDPPGGFDAGAFMTGYLIGGAK